MTTLNHSWVSVFGESEFLDAATKLSSNAFSSAPLEYPVEQADQITLRTTSSKLTKKFDGDDWKSLVAEVPTALRHTFICEASIALDVRPEALSNVQFRLGSLYVTFHVTHDEDVPQEEMERRIEEYPFREMWRLYNQRDGAPDGLDAALLRIKALESELKDKDRDLERERAANAGKINDLERQLHNLQAELEGPVADRERDLLDQLAKEQAARKKAESQLKAAEDQNKKLLDNLKQEKIRFEKNAQRHNDLIAAIIQENKKEKEAKEREYNEQLEMKDYVIESLKSQLRNRPDAGASPRMSMVDTDQAEEFSRLMERMEEMAQILQSTQESETEARGHIQRLSDALKQSEAARQAEHVTYENNMLAVRQQLNAYRDTGFAEDHEKRAKDNRQKNRGSVSQEVKENETIVRQYETALENIVGTLQDRLNILREEYASYVKVAEKEVESEKSILEEHEEDSQDIRKTFRSSSMTLQKIYWGTREAEVSTIIQDLDNAAASAEKSSAAIKVTLAMIDSKLKGFEDQKEWMESHQSAVQELIQSLRSLNKRAFERQLTMMNTTAAGNKN